MFYTTGILRNGTTPFSKYFNWVLDDSVKILQVRGYAARKGTREKKKKAKVKVEVEKVGFIPHNIRKKEKLLQNRPSKKFDDSWKKDPTDDVFVKKYYKQIIYPFEEAIQCHKEINHPEIYNQPNANVHLSVELYMQGEKKTRFVEKFTRVAGIPHKFEHGEERSIIAFSKKPEYQKMALDAGAQLAGGGELVKKIQDGLVSLHDFQFIIAHPDILPELVALRGLLKKRFPNPKAGTLEPDLGEAVARFFHGIKYNAIQDEYEKDFGSIDTIIGTLNMDSKHLEGNFSALVRDVNTMRPKRDGPFITRCQIWSPPSREKLRVDHNLYIAIENTEEQEENEEEDRIAL